MDGATLTINFRDDSAAIPNSPAATPTQGGSPQSSLVADQQEVITQAGGVGALAAHNQALQSAATSSQVIKSASEAQPPITPTVTTPVSPSVAPPIASTSGTGLKGEAGLAQSIRDFQAADPRATAEELAKLLGGGLGVNQVRGMMAPTTVPSTPTPVATTVTVPTTPTIPQPVVTPPLVPPPAPPTVTAPPIQGLTPPPLSREQQIDEAQRRAPPISPTARGVQATVGMLASLAARGGPLGAAIGQAGAVAASMPGAATALGTTAPVLASAAPVIAAATAALAIPTAALATVQGVAYRAEGQISGLSPQVAVAEAQASVRQLMANIRTAGVLGDEVAANINARSQISAGAQGLRDVIAEPFMRDLNANLELFGKALNATSNAANDNPILKAMLQGGTHGLARGLADVATFGLSELFFGTGTFAGTPTPQPTAGLMGIIPRRPSLPPPFGKETFVEADRTSIQTQGRMTPAL